MPRNSNEYQRLHYQANKAKYVERTKRRQRDLLAMIHAEKDKPCADCGKKYPPYVMDFDHRPGTVKLAGIANLHGKGWSKARIMEEIAKCDVVCANCHRIRTHTRSTPLTPEEPVPL